MIISIKRKNIFFLLLCSILFCLTTSCKVNKIHYGAFNQNVAVEDQADTRSYAVKTDGTRIYGNKVFAIGGFFRKSQISVDKQKIPVSQVVGFRSGQFYYTKYKDDFIKRIVHGKINVYILTITEQYQSGATGMWLTRQRSEHYIQFGDDGNITVIANQKDIMKAVSGCQTSVDMINKSDSKIRKAIRKNRNYLNEIFEIYNNDCTPITP